VNLWTSGVQDYAETGVNTLSAISEFFRGTPQFTSWPLDQIGPVPPFVRNAEVWSSSLLPSTILRSRLTRSLSAMALAKA
jgi:hypothetical protein